jgi:hypothetical protein
MYLVSSVLPPPLNQSLSCLEYPAHLCTVFIHHSLFYISHRSISSVSCPLTRHALEKWSVPSIASLAGG